MKKNSVCSITYVSDIADEINNGKLMISMSNILVPSSGPSIATVAIFHAKQHSAMVNGVNNKVSLEFKQMKVD